MTKDEIDAGDQAVVDSLNNIATAIREHTQHVREDDERYWSEQNKNEGQTDEPRTFSTFEESAQPQSIFDQYFGGRRSGRTVLEGSVLREQPLMISNQLVEILRETPHMFYEHGRRFDRTQERQCSLCLLRFKNPVHLILMAQLPTED